MSCNPCVCARAIYSIFISHQVFISWRQPQCEVTPVCSEAFAIGQGKNIIIS